MQIAGEVAVITGGASGIGRATALAMAREGADIVLADINQRRLDETRAEIEQLGRRVRAVRCDVTSDQQMQHLAQEAEALGPVGILMNNAGVVLRGALEQIEPSDWLWCLDINVLGIARGIRHFLPGMIARRHGYIINTGSVSGLVALTGEGAPYIASKFAVVGLTESLALYARPLGIGVSLLCPGGVRTNLAETGRSIGMTPDREVAETRMAQTVQGGVEREPEEIAAAVVRAVKEDRYFILPDAANAELVRKRAEDLETFLRARLEEVTRP